MFPNANCPEEAIDSNLTGLRYAWEECYRQLPANPVWHPLEPNSYADFGADTTITARRPISPSRQRRKGSITDRNASAGFTQDLTMFNLVDLLQGFCFAAAREKATTAGINATAPVAITAVDADSDAYEAASGLGSFKAGDIVLASGFGVAANNGLKTVVSATATSVTVSTGLTAEASPPAGAKLTVVGHAGAADDLSITVTDGRARLVSAGGTDFTTLGLIRGEWVYIGADGATAHFANNYGFARIDAIDATYLEFDRTTWTPQAESGAGLTVPVFFGTVIRNEPDPADIVKASVQLERTLGQDADGPMAEYVVGAIPNELTLNFPEADYVTVDMTFVAADGEYRSGAQGLKAGSRPALDASAGAINTSSDIARVGMSTVSEAGVVTPLFAFTSDLSLTINNGVTASKALGTLGAFTTSAGLFDVSGEVSAYFASMEAVRAVHSNADVSFDVIITKDNKGLLFDLPLVSLGNGRLAVELDQKIKIPLETQAVESKFGHTLLCQHFPYLPALAQS